MKTASLHRLESSDEGTFGLFYTEEGHTWHSGELPPHDNDPNKSCIPIGIYLCTYRFSPKHGMCYHVENVPGRTSIEIHPANFMGDSPPWKCQLLGCVALGGSKGKMNSQKCLFQSFSAVRDFEAAMGRQPFSLTIFS